MTAPAGKSLRIGVVKEEGEGERRVALTPDGVTRLEALGLRVAVEAGAGQGSSYADEDYIAAGAAILTRDAVYRQSDLILCISPPKAHGVAQLTVGQKLIGMLQPLVDLELVNTLAHAQVTALSLDGLPRTLSSAQSMDALTSQANVAGYKAALVAADAYGSYFPMLMTAAGTVRPAKVLVLGAGVAGLQAIGTARRLGAVVTAYDVREEARADVASTGATFLALESAAPPASSGDGYARELTPAEAHEQAAAMTKAIGTFDVVITTAQVPGRKPPVLVTKDALTALRSGAIVIDLASSPLGGNVEGSIPDATAVTTGGVTVIGAGNLPSTVPMAASTAYSRNIAALLAHLVKDGVLVLDRTDAITAGVLVTDKGLVVHDAVLARLAEHPHPSQLAPTG